MTSKKVQTLGEQLLQRGRSPASGAVAVLPVSEMPMVLTLDQLRPNPDTLSLSQISAGWNIPLKIYTRTCPPCSIQEWVRGRLSSLYPSARLHKKHGTIFRPVFL